MGLTRVRSGGIDYKKSTFTDATNSGSITLDFKSYANFILTFTGDVTFANPSTEEIGQSGVIVCIQDGTGGRTLTLSSDFETASGLGVSLSSAANSVDIIPYIIKAQNSILLGKTQKAFQ